MTTPLTASIQQSIAANKFYPPRINTSQSIDRHSIITDRTGDGRRLGKDLIGVHGNPLPARRGYIALRDDNRFDL